MNKKIIEVTSENFEEVVKSANKVVVDFWAPWCGPCRALAPILEELVEKTNDVIVAKVNVDDFNELSAKFGVTNIPTMVFYSNGKLVEGKKEVGLKTVEYLTELVESL